MLLVSFFLPSFNSLFFWVQDNRIEPQRYYELIEKDTIRFGNSRYAINGYPSHISYSPDCSNFI